MQSCNKKIPPTLFILLLTMTSCATREVSISAIEDPQARWSRGDSGDGCYFTLAPDQRRRMIHEINELPLGCSMDETIRRLGKADLVYQTGDKTPVDSQSPGYCVMYSFRQKYKNRSDKGEDESVQLFFANDQLTGVQSDIEAIPQRPAPDNTFADPSDEKVVIIGTYPDPSMSEKNAANHLAIRRIMRGSSIAYETWLMGKNYQILVSRADSERAQRILSHALRDGKIAGHINGWPDYAPVAKTTD
jgi:hypothetical protein